MNRKARREKHIMQQMCISSRKPVSERPDIGRPVKFENGRDKMRRRSSKQFQRVLKDAMNVSNY